MFRGVQVNMDDIVHVDLPFLSFVLRLSRHRLRKCPLRMLKRCRLMVGGTLNDASLQSMRHICLLVYGVTVRVKRCWMVAV